MHRLPLVPVFLLLLTGLGAVPLPAQQVPSPYRYIEPTREIGAFVGYLAADRGDRNLGPGSGIQVGTRFDIRLSGPLSGEIALSAVPTDRRIFVRSALPGDTTLNEVDETDALILLAEAGLRFHITGPRTWNGLAPFALGSLGLVGDVLGASEDEEDLPADQRFEFGPGLAVAGALGTDWFPTERWSVRLEARNYFWRISTPEGLTPSGRRDSDWTSNFGLSLGAAFHF